MAENDNPVIAKALTRIEDLAAELQRLQAFVNQADTLEGRQPRFDATGPMAGLSGAGAAGSRQPERSGPLAHSLESRSLARSEQYSWRGKRPPANRHLRRSMKSTRVSHKGRSDLIRTARKIRRTASASRWVRTVWPLFVFQAPTFLASLNGTARGRASRCARRITMRKILMTRPLTTWRPLATRR